MVLVRRIGHAAIYCPEARGNSAKEQQDGTLVKLYTIDFIELSRLGHGVLGFGFIRNLASMISQVWHRPPTFVLVHGILEHT
jgi:hypothetical protein